MPEPQFKNTDFPWGLYNSQDWVNFSFFVYLIFSVSIIK